MNFSTTQQINSKLNTEAKPSRRYCLEVPSVANLNESDEEDMNDRDRAASLELDKPYYRN